MIRLLYVTYIVIIFATSILLLSPFILFFSLWKNSHIVFNIIKYYTKWFLWMIGMSPEIIGKKPDGKYIFVANHISYLDSLVIFSSIPGYLRVLGNKEFSKKFLIGLIYRQLTVMVDRGDASSRAKSLKILWDSINNGNNIFIFPEGKFNTSNEILSPFYDGAFKLAINTKTPIYPMILPDTKDRWHYSSWWKFSPGRNRLIFLDPIEIDTENIVELKQKVFSIIEKKLKSVNNEC